MLSAADSSRLSANSVALQRDFVDEIGHAYSGFFDGKHVVFSDGSTDYTGEWLQGTVATVIRQSRRLPSQFTFTFMDHGNTPQRLHAVWEFEGALDSAVEGWKRAGFIVSNVDRYLNRNHPRSSIHLRTRGAFWTGADSSHVVIPGFQVEKFTTGEIHVGEFNPFTGLGIGLLLHLLEGKSLKRR